MALAKLEILLSMSSNALRSQMKAVSSLVNQSMGDIAKLGNVLDNMSKGQGDLFRAPTGRGQETQFANAVTAATAFQRVIDNLETQLGAFQNSLVKITGPLRDSAQQSLAAAAAMKQQSGSLMAFQKSMGSAVMPVNLMNAAISRSRASILGLEAPISKLASGLSFFSLVNYNVRASIESWNALAVLRGPGLLVSLADKINRVVFGLQPPMRILQFMLTKFLIPAIVALGMALQQTANNPAARILGENLVVLAAQMKNLGNSYTLTILTKIAAAFGLVAGASAGAVKAMWAFGNKSVTEAFTLMAKGALKTAQALGVLAARAAVVGVIKTLELSIRLLFKTMTMATSAILRFAMSLAQVAGRAAKTVGSVLTLGMAFRKSAGDADALGKSVKNASSGFSKWSLLPGIISPSLGLLAGFGAALGGIAIAAKGAAIGISAAINTEKAQLQFETLLGSAQAATKRIEELSQFSAKTPFQFPDIIEANRLLQTFGGSALASGKMMQMVGDMAAGAGQDLAGVSMWVGRLYAGLKAGKPIGEATARLREMGLITPELEKDLERLGQTDPAAAFEAFQKGMGRFAGVMEKQSRSIGGLLSTLKDNVTLFFRDLMGGIMDSINVKGGIAALISGFDTARNTLVPVVVGMVNGFVKPIMAGVSMVAGFISANLPTIQTTFNTVFTSVYAIVSSVMTTIYSLIIDPLMAVVTWVSGTFASIFGGSFSSIMMTVSKAFWTIEYAVKNWQATLELAAIGSALQIVRFGAIVQHWFTVALPAYLAWFGRNWTNLFVDLFNGTKTIFTNLGTNITNVFREIWAFIASGGTKAFEFTWMPLLDGFKATTEALPAIAARQMGPLESALQGQFQDVSNRYNQGLSGFLDEKIKALEEQQKETTNQIGQAANIQTPDANGGLFDGFGGGDGKSGGSSIQSGASALQRGSEAAQSALNRSIGSSNPMVKAQKEQLTETKKQTSAIVAQTAAIKTGFTLKVATV